MTLDPTWEPHIEAEITFLRAEEGGRQWAAFSGYRPQFRYRGKDWDAIQEYPDGGRAEPGQTVRALLSFVRPQYHRGRVYPGMAFEICEGARVIGRGIVTRVLSF
jgi:translation elongation factor EF-Tu-like GTPase